MKKTFLEYLLDEGEYKGAIPEQKLNELIQKILLPGVKYSKKPGQCKKTTYAVDVFAFNARSERAGDKDVLISTMLRDNFESILNGNGYQVVVAKSQYDSNIVHSAIDIWLQKSTIIRLCTANSKTNKSTNASKRTTVQEQLMADMIAEYSHTRTFNDDEHLTLFNPGEILEDWSYDALKEQVELLFETLHLNKSYECSRRDTSAIHNSLVAIQKALKTSSIDNFTPADVIMFSSSSSKYIQQLNDTTNPDEYCTILKDAYDSRDIILVSLKQPGGVAHIEVMNENDQSNYDFECVFKQTSPKSNSCWINFIDKSTGKLTYKQQFRIQTGWHNQIGTSGNLSLELSTDNGSARGGKAISLLKSQTKFNQNFNYIKSTGAIKFIKNEDFSTPDCNSLKKQILKNSNVMDDPLANEKIIYIGLAAVMKTFDDNGWDMSILVNFAKKENIPGIRNPICVKLY